MDKEDINTCLAAIDEASELLIALAGNMRLAEKVIGRDEDIQRAYSRIGIYIDYEGVLSTLHSLALSRISLNNGLDDLEREERQAAN